MVVAAARWAVASVVAVVSVGRWGAQLPSKIEAGNRRDVTVCSFFFSFLFISCQDYCHD